MLRAVEGEQTRTTYRLDWVTPQALTLLRSEVTPLCVASLVDRQGSHALPSRLMTVLEHSIDNDTGNLRLLFEMGPFIALNPDFNGQISTWGTSLDEAPPNKFVTIYDDSWPEYREVKTSESLDSWKRAIYFVTTSWDFKNTVFLRPTDPNLIGSEKSITLSLAQETALDFSVASFNPHLTDVDLGRKQIQVTSRGAIADINACPPIDRDGIMSITGKFLEPGLANLEINVQPDPQFSTYLPLSLTVTADPNSDPVGPRVLGQPWVTCLDQLADSLQTDKNKHLEILNYLADAFPGDPEVLLRRGSLYLSLNKYSMASDEFRKVLKIRESSRAVTWLLIAALKSGDVREAESLLNRLNLSEQNLFNQIVESASSVTEDTALRFIDAPGMSMGEDKAVKLIYALSKAVKTHEGARKVTASMADVDQTQAVIYARRLIEEHPDWRALRKDYVELAHETGLSDGVNEQVEILLRYEDESPKEIVDRVNRLGNLLHPVRLLGTLIFNSTAFFALQTTEATVAGLELSTQAADLALRVGDFATLDFAVQQVMANVENGNTTHMGYLSAVEQIALRASKSHNENTSSIDKSESYIDYFLQKLSNETSKKTLVVIGGSSNFRYLEHWKQQLKLKDFKWIPGSPTAVKESECLLELDPENLIVVTVWSDAIQLSNSVLSWLEKYDVQIGRAFSGSESILYAVSTLLKLDEISPIDISFQRCVEAFNLAKTEFKFLEFNPGINEVIKELDEYPLARPWARKIWRSLDALNQYAAWRASQSGSATAFIAWLTQSGLIPPNWVSMKESESLAAQSQYYQVRVFPVDKSVDPSGKIFMEPHIKIDFDHPAPRIHFFDASAGVTKKIFIGYIGPHLPTPSGH